jgi:hypothetical protein
LCDDACTLDAVLRSYLPRRTHTAMRVYAHYEARIPHHERSILIQQLLRVLNHPQRRQVEYNVIAAGLQALADVRKDSKSFQTVNRGCQQMKLRRESVMFIV